MSAASSAMTAPRRPVVSSAVLGTLIFAVAELMFFAGVMSAFTISRRNSLPGMWPPPGLPALPASQAGLHTLLLLASAGALAFAFRRYKRAPASASLPWLAAWLLGATFAGLQLWQWAALSGAGLTMTSSALGSFYALLVGGHTLHVLAGLAALAVGWVRLRRGTLTAGAFFGVQVLWYFVAGLWPVIYARVYF